MHSIGSLNSGLILASILLLSVSPASAQQESELLDRLAEASPAEGQLQYRKCRLCHTVDRGGGQKLGPNLYGIVDAPVAAVAEFGKYSRAMREFGGFWTLERLDAYLRSPRETIPGTSMQFIGISDVSERAAVIVHLNQFSDQPRIFR